MKITRSLLLTACFLIFPGLCLGAEIGKLQFSGFSFMTASKVESQASKGVERGHTWLLFKLPLDSTTTVLAIIAPEGPPRLLHNMQIEWQTRTWPVIYAVTFGRFIPPFADEFANVRIDRTRTVAYSRVLNSSRLVARDTGLQFTSRILHNWQADVAIFAGDRTGSDIPASRKGDPDFYARTQYLRGNNVAKFQIGASERWGPVKATAINASLERPQYLASLTGQRALCGAIAFEGIWLHGQFDYFALASLTPWSQGEVLYRYESLDNHSDHTIGLGWRFNHYLCAKLNYSVGYALNTIVGQAVIQW